MVLPDGGDKSKAREWVSKLGQHIPVHYVGGAVRDEALGKEPKDLDLITTAPFHEVKRTLDKLNTNHFVASSHSETITAKIGDELIDIVSVPKDGFDEDLSRRDFTINAIAKTPAGKVTDPHGGMADLRAKRLRFPGGRDTISEDPVRAYRAARFIGEYGLEADQAVNAAIKSNSGQFGEIPKERIAGEFKKISKLPVKDMVKSLRFMEEHGMLEAIHPALQEMVGFDQKSKNHKYDVWNHSLASLEATDRDDPLLKVAVLLHDIGKPSTADGKGHFYGHDETGETIAKEVMKNMQYSEEDRNHVGNLIRHHMFVHSAASSGAKDPAYRRVKNAVDGDTDNLMALGRADTLGNGYSDHTGHVDEAKERFDNLKEIQQSKDKSYSPMNGKEIMDYLDLKGGRMIGQLKDHLSNLVIDEKLDPNDENATKDALNSAYARFSTLQKARNLGFTPSMPLDKTGLVMKSVDVHPKKGSPFKRKMWVRPEDVSKMVTEPTDPNVGLIPTPHSAEEPAVMAHGVPIRKDAVDVHLAHHAQVMDHPNDRHPDEQPIIAKFKTPRMKDGVPTGKFLNHVIKHPDYAHRNSLNKFKNLAKFNPYVDSLRETYKDGISDPETASDGDIMLYIISHYGDRPGRVTGRSTSGDDHFGVSTFQARHMSLPGDGRVRFKYKGKGGIDHDRTVVDPTLEAAMKPRLEAKTGKERLFKGSELDSTWSETKPYEGAKIKDFRTNIATDIAIKAIAKRPRPRGMKTIKDLRKYQQEICMQVGKALGHKKKVEGKYETEWNTSFKNYVSPVVWDEIERQLPEAEQKRLNEAWDVAGTVIKKAITPNWEDKIPEEERDIDDYADQRRRRGDDRDWGLDKTPPKMRAGAHKHKRAQVKPLRRSLTKSRTWIGQLQDRGFRHPLIKSVSPNGGSLWFVESGHDFVATMSTYGIIHIEKGTFKNNLAHPHGKSGASASYNIDHVKDAETLKGEIDKDMDGEDNSEQT